MDSFNKLFKRPDEVLEMVPTPESFTELVDLIVDRYNISYFETITEICTHYDRDPNSIKPLITPKIKIELFKEASDRKLLKDNTFSKVRLG